MPSIGDCYSCSDITPMIGDLVIIVDHHYTELDPSSLYLVVRIQSQDSHISNSGVFVVGKNAQQKYPMLTYRFSLLSRHDCDDK